MRRLTLRDGGLFLLGLILIVPIIAIAGLVLFAIYFLLFDLAALSVFYIVTQYDYRLRRLQPFLSALDRRAIAFAYSRDILQLALPRPYVRRRTS